MKDEFCSFLERFSFQHIDGIPRTIAGTENAADTCFLVDQNVSPETVLTKGFKEWARQESNLRFPPCEDGLGYFTVPANRRPTKPRSPAPVEGGISGRSAPIPIVFHAVQDVGQ